MKPMKILTLNNDTYEIVDADARSQLELVDGKIADAIAQIDTNAPLVVTVTSEVNEETGETVYKASHTGIEITEYARTTGAVLLYCLGIELCYTEYAPLYSLDGDIACFDIVTDDCVCCLDILADGEVQIRPKEYKVNSIDLRTDVHDCITIRSEDNRQGDTISFSCDGDRPVILHNIADGTATNDAVNKGQLDAAIASVGGSAPTSLVGKTTEAGGEIFNDYENNEASGNFSHAEGFNTTAEGENAHAEGSDTTATGDNSHTEGQGTNTTGTNSHAEGHSTTAEGENAHAEGEGTFAEGHNSHAEGYDTVAKGEVSHAEGYKSAAVGEASHAEGTNKANLYGAEYTTTVEFITPYPELLPEGADPETPITVEVNGATAIGVGAHAEGCTTLAYGYSSHAEGCDTFARGGRSHSEGTSTKAWGHKSHAEGGNTIAVGIASHAEGEGIGFYKFINQDADTVCNDWKSLDRDNKFHMAYGTDSHVEGKNNLAAGTASHAEGFATLSQGTAAHTEGRETVAIGMQAHAEGRDTVAQGSYSHAEGQGTIAKYNHQHVQGKYNEPLGSNYLHIVGNGSGEDVLDEDGNIVTKNRSNAHTVDKNGNAWFAGDVYVGESGENNKLITKKQLDEAIYQIIDLLVASGVAPVMLDANGEMLVENDGTILINM